MIQRLSTAFRSVRRECRNGFGYAVAWFVRRFHLRFLRRRFDGLPPPTPDDDARPLTVVVPAVEKDLDVLGHCLRAVREQVANRIAAFWIVAPESSAIRALAAEVGAEFVHEDTILPRPAKELKTRGWVLQQLIKFNVALKVPTREYLVLDADTVFLKRQHFVRGGRVVLRYSDQYELLYNRSLELIFGHTRRFPVSFVTHHQVFEVEVVKDLMEFVGRRFQRTWWEAILTEVDQGHLISFSEYELYGHHVLASRERSARVALEYWHGLDLDGSDLARLDELRQTAPPAINSLSFHRHTQ